MSVVRMFVWPAAFCLAFACYILSPLLFNRDEMSPGIPQHKCTKHINDIANDPRSIPRPDDSIKYIRLTNAGEFVDRCDLTNALDEIVWDRKLPNGPMVKPGAEHSPKLVVLYIHGWKHNANPADSDRKNFEKFILDIRGKVDNGQRVVGIYIGWNGDGGLPAVLENITFWTKENNAERIAQSSSVTMIVSAIGATVRSAEKRDEQFVAIGHSFGARILYSASAQSLISATEQAHPGFRGGNYSTISGIADAVILLNPAFEASRYTAMAGFTRSDESFAIDQQPLLLSISSDADWATTTAFPIGRWLGSSRAAREKQTIGNYIPYQTHFLTKNQSACSKKNQSMTDSFLSSDLCLQRLGRDDLKSETTEDRVIQKHNPFIIARTTGDIISGHNDIWREDLRAWLATFIKNLSDAKRTKFLQ